MVELYQSSEAFLDTKDAVCRKNVRSVKEKSALFSAPFCWLYCYWQIGQVVFVNFNSTCDLLCCCHCRGGPRPLTKIKNDCDGKKVGGKKV